MNKWFNRASIIRHIPWKISKRLVKNYIDCNKSENVIKYYLLGKLHMYAASNTRLMFFYFHWNIIIITSGLPTYIGYIKGNKIFELLQLISLKRQDDYRNVFTFTRVLLPKTWLLNITLNLKIRILFEKSPQGNLPLYASNSHTVKVPGWSK